MGPNVTTDVSNVTSFNAQGGGQTFSSFSMHRVVVNLFFFSSEWAGASDELQVMPIAWKTEMTSQDGTTLSLSTATR